MRATRRALGRAGLAGLTALLMLLPMLATGDETITMPGMPKITGQEEFVYVWTLGAEGVGDEQDKLVTVDVDPASPRYGTVISTVSVGGRNEAHHAGFTLDRRYLWGATLDTSKIFVFDLHTDPARPRLVRTIDDFVARSGGVVGPHTVMPLGDRMFISGLSNNRDHGGRTALVEYTADGSYVATYWMPTDDDLRGARKTGKYADGYGYDVRIIPRLDAMVTSSFTGWTNYMMDFGKMLRDEEAMKRFGNTVVVWSLSERAPAVIFDVPGAPLEIRCGLDPAHDYCFTTTALTSKIWLVHRGAGGWKAQEVGEIGDPAQVPLPVAFSRSADDRRLWVSTFMDGKVRAFDVSDPFHPVQTYEKKIGSQVNMVSQSWDGTRLYFTSSLLSRWDKKGEDNEQFLKGYLWDGRELEERFAIDFTGEKLGRPHHMKFGAHSLYDDHASTPKGE